MEIRLNISISNLKLFFYIIFSVASKSAGGERAKVLETRNIPGCSLGAFTWVFLEMPGGGKVWGAVDTGLVNRCSSPSTGGDTNLNQAGNPGFKYDFATTCTGGPAAVCSF